VPHALQLRKSFGCLLITNPVRFLDPSIGTGSFFSALQEAFPPKNIEAAHGVELDPLFANTAMELRLSRGFVSLKVPSNSIGINDGPGPPLSQPRSRSRYHRPNRCRTSVVYVRQVTMLREDDVEVAACRPHLG
jgi:hypothetical protein